MEFPCDEAPDRLVRKGTLTISLHENLTKIEQGTVLTNIVFVPDTKRNEPALHPN